MTIVNFREAEKKYFGHVDAELVGYRITSEEKGSYYSVRYYPFWTHPLYKRDETDFFAYPETAKVVFTVHPVNLMRARVNCAGGVTDWYFSGDDPMLWEYENTGSIFINAAVSTEQAVQALALLEAKNPRIAQHSNLLYRLLKRLNETSFSLGLFPRTVFLAVCEVLTMLQIDFFAPSEPPRKDLPLVFFGGGSDYIIAEDFEVDIPEIRHEPAWILGSEYKGALAPK